MQKNSANEKSGKNKEKIYADCSESENFGNSAGKTVPQARGISSNVVAQNNQENRDAAQPVEFRDALRGANRLRGWGRRIDDLTHLLSPPLQVPIEFSMPREEIPNPVCGRI